MAALSRKLRSLEGGLIGFWCPGCDGMHAVRVSSPKGGNWSFDGNVALLTFSPSVLVTYNGADAGHEHIHGGGRAPPATCHSFVRAGRIQFLGDCTHALAGQTVELPDLPGEFQ